ncbi:hypothetical protein LVJ94_26720 [Pendulispora rubella]|uniref:Secreted protein n=1 Tax=Pendulispora rubella TaxID=2741070 RepID=A0ABZ2KPB3_9BACT
MRIVRSFLVASLAAGSLAMIAPISAHAATGTVNVCGDTYVDPSGDIHWDGSGGRLNQCFHSSSPRVTNNTDEAIYILVQFGRDEPTAWYKVEPGESKNIPFGFWGIRAN